MPQPIGDSRLIEMPGHLIRRLHQISFALFLDQAKAFAVTPVQYAALVAIERHPGIDQTTLCNVIAFDRTTIGGVVGRLQRKKLITRVNGAHDRRTKEGLGDSAHSGESGNRGIFRSELTASMQSPGPLPHRCPE